MRQRQSQVDDEARAGTQRTADIDAAAHLGHQVLADRQAQPRAAEAASGRAIGLREVLEDLGQSLGGDADAGVLDADLEVRLPFGAGEEVHAHRHFALVGELHRIAHQVRHHLAKAEGVSAQPPGGMVLRELHRQREALGCSGLVEHGRRLLHDIHQVEVDRLQFQVPGLDFRKVQDVVEDAQQVLPRLLQHLGPGALLRVQRTADEQVVHAQNAVHGRADLMAHRGQELGLGPVGLLGTFLGQAQFGRAALHGELDLGTRRAFALQGRRGGLQQRIGRLDERTDLIMTVPGRHSHALHTAWGNGFQSLRQPDDGPRHQPLCCRVQHHGHDDHQARHPARQRQRLLVRGASDVRIITLDAQQPDLLLAVERRGQRPVDRHRADVGHAGLLLADSQQCTLRRHHLRSGHQGVLGQPFHHLGQQHRIRSKGTHGQCSLHSIGQAFDGGSTAGQCPVMFQPVGQAPSQGTEHQRTGHHPGREADPQADPAGRAQVHAGLVAAAFFGLDPDRQTHWPACGPPLGWRRPWKTEGRAIIS